MLRQCADAQLDGAQRVETIGETGADNANEPRCQSALRCHHAFGRERHLKNRPCRGDVFGQIEIVHSLVVRDASDAHIEVKRQTGNHRVVIRQGHF